jgi:dTDP-4-dehydrorhamnose reductase
MGNNILVLGSNGFIGSYLTKNLDCVGVSRKEVDLTKFNSLYKVIRKYKPYTIINCAGNTDTNLVHFNYNSFHENLTIYRNISKLKDEFGQLINFGSGAEFDRMLSITDATEKSIFYKLPTDHYGLSKNIISRDMYKHDNFYTFRLFGCFHGSEPNTRLLKSILNSDNIINDRYFDYFWLPDILKVVEYYLDQNSNKIKDINLVYNKKIPLSVFVRYFLRTYNISRDIIFEVVNNDYTGSSEKLDSLNLSLGGLRKGIEEYYK